MEVVVVAFKIPFQHSHGEAEILYIKNCQMTSQFPIQDSDLVPLQQEAWTVTSKPVVFNLFVRVPPNVISLQLGTTRPAGA
jgi:hypothetical protein